MGRRGRVSNIVVLPEDLVIGVATIDLVGWDTDCGGCSGRMSSNCPVFDQQHALGALAMRCCSRATIAGIDELPYGQFCAHGRAKLGDEEGAGQGGPPDRADRMKPSGSSAGE